MAIELELEVNVESLKKIKSLSALSRLATAKALTFTAKDAKEKLTSSIPQYFHLRNQWVMKSVRITPANTTRLRAEVGSIDKYMERHVIGAAHPPKIAAKPLHIFGSNGQHGRISSGGLVIRPYQNISQAPKHQIVRKQLQKNQARSFQIVGKSGGVLIMSRSKKGGKKTNGKSGLQVLAAIESRAEIKQTWPMEKIVMGVAQARFTDHFAYNMNRALR